jgi:hypothetical protein
MDAERIYIFVLDRGFVVVGRASISSELLHHWRLAPGRTIRQWGTTQGLAELVNGPTVNTVLDVPAHRLVPFRSIIEILEVDQEKWEPHLLRNLSSGSKPVVTKHLSSSTETG